MPTVLLTKRFTFRNQKCKKEKKGKKGKKGGRAEGRGGERRGGGTAYL